MNTQGVQTYSELLQTWTGSDLRNRNLHSYFCIHLIPVPNILRNVWIWSTKCKNFNIQYLGWKSFHQIKVNKICCQLSDMYILRIWSLIETSEAVQTNKNINSNLTKPYLYQNLSVLSCVWRYSGGCLMDDLDIDWTSQVSCVDQPVTVSRRLILCFAGRFCSCYHFTNSIRLKTVCNCLLSTSFYTSLFT